MFTNAILLGIVVAGLSADRSAETAMEKWVALQLPQLISLYREFHAQPELSFHEKETAKKLAHELRAVGAEVTTGVGGHGVVGVLKNGPGKTLMLRTDLDALPITEKTRLVFASKVRTNDDQGVEVGVMHACGHDVHMTNLIGVARYLADHRQQWKGTVVFIGQPAEEMGAGAQAMLEDGLFKRFPRPDFAVALHVDATLAAGSVGILGGYALANVDSVDITMHGKGGHGAQPHTTIDPIVQAAQLVLALQTIVSREIKPIEPAVITVGSIHAGTKHNIISDRCHLQLTVRSYSSEVRKKLIDGIRRKAKAAAMSAGARPPTMTVSQGTPSLFNDKDLAKRLAGVFRQVLGESQMVVSEPSMGGEDFSQYGKAGVPILMYRLGAVDKRRLERFKQLGQPPPSLHSPFFYPDIEDTLSTGVITMAAAAALELLKPKQN